MEAKAYRHIVVEKRRNVGIIRLNRPEVLNALNLKLMEELVEALEAFHQDESVRSIVITGGERVFSAGADVKELAAMSPVEFLLENRFLLWDRIRKISKPIIAAVAGYCIGGGLELAMNCDIIIASEDAMFGQPEISLGLIPGAGGTQRLTRIVGKHKAMEHVLTGKLMNSREAEGLGLVNRVVPKELLMEEALKLAEELASKAPIALRLAKESVLRAFDTPIEVGLDYERKAFYISMATEDGKEGLRAFVEKRAPQFKGR